MLYISSQITLPDREIELNAMRSQGAGGQNVNKVSSAIHLRFDVRASSLPNACKQRLLALQDQRISKEGVIIIKAQRYRDQEKNREDALKRLSEMIRRALVSRKRRVPTKATRRSQQKRLDSKAIRGRQKDLRRKIRE